MFVKHENLCEDY